VVLNMSPVLRFFGSWISWVLRFGFGEAEAVLSR
jgi:hypothetical protein